MFFWILWGIDAIATIVAVVFLFVGIADGSVSPENGGIWTLLVGSPLALALMGSLLKYSRHSVLVSIVLLVPALPAVLYGVFLLIMLFSDTPWR